MFEPLCNKSRLYEEISLQDAQKQIRLLRFRTTAQTGHIDCEMTTHALDESPEFNAISYTWGDPGLRSTIFVENLPIPVRQNCHYALWQARSHCSGSYIWMDSICIDQANLQEKGSQVSLMGDIYARASRVLACIGRSDSFSDAVSVMMNDVVVEAAKLNIDANTTRVRGNDDDFDAWLSWMESQDEDLLASQYRGFCSRPYFRRLWIAQELEAGESRIVMLCGAGTICWPHLCLLDDVIECWPDTKIDGPLLDLRRLLESNKDHGLQFVLHWTDKLECQDPRDRIYGTYRFIDWQFYGIAPLVPDYTINEWDLALRVLRNFRRVQGLCIRSANVIYILRALRVRPEEPRASEWMRLNRQKLGLRPLAVPERRLHWRFNIEYASVIQEDSDHVAHANLWCWDGWTASTDAAPMSKGSDGSLTVKSTLESDHFDAEGIMRLHTSGDVSALCYGAACGGDIIVEVFRVPTKTIARTVGLILRPTDHAQAFQIVGQVVTAPGYRLEKVQNPCECFKAPHHGHHGRTHLMADLEVSDEGCLVLALSQMARGDEMSIEDVVRTA